MSVGEHELSGTSPANIDSVDASGVSLEPKICYRDAHCVIVDKPAGIIVHRGWADDANDLLRTVRDLVGCYVYPLHRLDRGASGLVAFALNREAASHFGRAFAERHIEKRYIALTRGHPAESGVVDHPIPKAPGEARVPALTRYRRLGTAGRYALVEAWPETGRLHQIRRHFKHLSCPLIGDVRYGKGLHNRLFREEYGLQRLALHAVSLRLAHPVTGADLQVHAPLSGSFRTCLAALGLLDALVEAG